MVQGLRVHLVFLIPLDKLRLYVFRILVSSQNLCLITFHNNTFLCIICQFLHVRNYLVEDGICLNLASSGCLKTIFGNFFRRAFRASVVSSPITIS